MERKQLASVRAETNLTRAPGLWATGQLQLELPLDAPGLGVAIRANGRLNLTPDLDVLAWLCERWYTTRLPDRSGKVHPHPEGIVAFTLTDLGFDLYGRKPAGKENRTVREALLRLFRVEVSMTGYDAADGKAGASLASLTRLIHTISSDRLDAAAADPRKLGALRGDTFKVVLAPWLLKQYRAGNFTFLSWRILRQLDGAAKRSWVFLEGQRFKPQGEGLLAYAVGLGQPALASLGVGEYARHRDARRALERAGKRIVEADDRFHSVTVERRPGGYALIAVRLDKDRLKVRREARSSVPA
jgi:hypothetical protein